MNKCLKIFDIITTICTPYNHVNFIVLFDQRIIILTIPSIITHYAKKTKKCNLGRLKSTFFEIVTNGTALKSSRVI